MAEKKKMTWDYPLSKVSMEAGVAPCSVPPGRFPLVVGADGRFDGVLKRYPGHRLYNTERPDGATSVFTTCDKAIAFEVQADSQSDERIRGVIAGDRKAVSHANDSSDYWFTLELWYRHEDDTEGELTNQELLDYSTGIQVGAYDADTTTSDVGGGLHSLDRGTRSLRSGEIILKDGTIGYIQDAILHDDGTTGGEVPYICGKFHLAGSADCTGVARLIGNRWEAVGTAAFFGGYSPQCLEVHDGKLYMGGGFTSYKDSDCKRLAVWDGKDWSCAGVINDGNVFVMQSFDTNLYIGGTFTSIHESPTATKYICYLDADGTLNEMDGGYGVSAAVYSMCKHTESATDYLVVGGTFTTNGTGGKNLPRCIGFYTETSNEPGVVDAVDEGGDPISPTSMTSLLSHGGKVYGGWQNTSGATDHGLVDISTIVAGAVWDSLASYTGASQGRIESLVTDGNYIWVIGGWGNFSDDFNNTSYRGVVRWDVAGGEAVGVSSYENDSPLSRATGSYPGCMTSMWIQGGKQYFCGGARLRSTASIPIADGSVSWSIAARGPYLYLFLSNGNHKVLTWNSENENFDMSRLGPGNIWLPAPTLTAENGNAVADIGYYSTAFRLVDRERGRYSALSELAEGVATPDASTFLKTVRPSRETGDYVSYFDGINTAQVFRTLWQGNATSQAGGTPYLDMEFEDSEMQWIHWSLSTLPVRDTIGTPQWASALSDESLTTLPNRAYDYARDSVFEARSVYAAAYYQGSMFILEENGGRIAIRWSPTNRVEPESFPVLNLFQTEIEAADGGSCSITEAGDYLLVCGGHRIYRIQKAGNSVGIIELYKGFPILSDQGVVVANKEAIVATEHGLLSVEPRSGKVTHLKRTDWIFHERWANNIGSSRGLTTWADYETSSLGPSWWRGILAGYDARMRCVYFHHRGYAETLCLWLDTAKVTLLVYHHCNAIVTSPDLDTGTGQRAYFIGTDRFLATPNYNWDPDYPAVMNPFVLGDNHQECNQTLAWVDAGLGNGTRCILEADYPGIVNSSGTHLWRNGGYVATLTGPDAGQMRFWSPLAASGGKTSPNPADRDTNDNYLTPHVYAISPVVFGVVGSNLWSERGTSDVWRRKTIVGSTVSVGKVNSGGSTPQLAPISDDYGLITFGSCRDDGLRDTWPLESDNTLTYMSGNSLWTNLGSADSPGGATLNSDDPSANTASYEADGNVLYPTFLCLTSNLNMEVQGWRVSGKIEESRTAGTGSR